jgi:PKD repeat protein
MGREKRLYNYGGVMSTSLKSMKLYFGSTFILIALFHAAPVSVASDDVSLTLPDTAPPLIVRVYAEDITSDSVAINWTTDENSDTQVEYGISRMYGHTSDMDSSMVTDHRQMLTDLSPSTQYHYRVWSQDAEGNLSISGDHVFKTTAASDPPFVAVNQPPVISFLNVVPSSGTAPLSVIFWVGASDPDGEVIEYDWDFDGNGSVDAVTTSNRISFTYNQEGIYSARVRIFDDEGASTISGPVTIKAVKTGVKQGAVNSRPFSFLEEPFFNCTCGCFFSSITEEAWADISERYVDRNQHSTAIFWLSI